MNEFARYIVNGLVATAVHYAVLTFNLKVLHVPYAAVANLAAAVVGITASFLGSRYFVFRKYGEPWWVQATRFSGLYVAIALLHALVLLGWTDWLRLDYTFGFLIATTLQVALSYSGNKMLVFRA